MKTGMRGRIAGRTTVGSRQRPHTKRSQQYYDELSKAVWEKIQAEAKQQRQVA